MLVASLKDVEKDRPYVYTHALSARDGHLGVFYVGKGVNKRCLNFESRSEYHKRIVGKYGRENVTIELIYCNDEAMAKDYEIRLIRQFRKRGNRLANMSDGGEGASGFKHTKETRAKISEAKRGDKNPMKRPEVVAKVRKSREKLDQEKINAKMRQYWDNPVWAEKFSVSQKKTWLDEEIRARRTAFAKSPEGRAIKGKFFRENNPSSRPEVKIMRSKKSKEMWAKPEYRANISRKISESWTPERKEAYSKCNPSHDPEINAKKSEAMRKFVWPTYTCPHCDKVGVGNAMVRHHMDNCKKRVV